MVHGYISILPALVDCDESMNRKKKRKQIMAARAKAELAEESTSPQGLASAGLRSPFIHLPSNLSPGSDIINRVVPASLHPLRGTRPAGEGYCEEARAARRTKSPAAWGRKSHSTMARTGADSPGLCVPSLNWDLSKPRPPRNHR